MQITINHTIKLVGICLILLLFATTVHSQFAPAWNISLYIEAKSFSVVASTQKSFGSYPTAVTFSGIYPIPSLALSIPQLRMVSNNGAMDFKCVDSNLNQISFTHTLEISNTNTIIWHMQVRYFVVSLQLLPNTIRSVLYTCSTCDINKGYGTGLATGTTKSITHSFSNINYHNNTTPTVCVPFVTGVTAISTNHYQLNITCAMASAISFLLTATVHPDTEITDLTVYVVMYNPDNLAVYSIYFADYTITETYLGTQTKFASLPYGYYDQNFIGGLSSFSFQNNIEYNNTLSIPISNLVYTSPSSLYNSVPQLQFRVRYCPTAYTYYNIRDGLCYTVCPSTTYANSSGFICYACGDYCLTCLNNYTCTTCISTMILQIIGTSAICVCPISSYYYNGACYECDQTCLTCTATGQWYNCESCDPNNYRQHNTTNKTCHCKSGYYHSGAARCTQICGDAKAITDQCDDDNTWSGDGCSSTCVIQPDFICQKDSNLNSTCYYIGNVTIEVKGIYKLQFSNQVEFYIVIKPYIPIMNILCNSSSTNQSYNTLFSNYSFTLVSCRTYIDPDQPDVVNFVYKGKYEQSIEDMYIRFDLKPTNTTYNTTLSRMPPTNTTVKLVSSNAYRLKYYQKRLYDIASDFRYACLVFGFLMLGTAPLYIFGRLKWVGNMLFLSLQFQYLNMAILDYFTPMLSSLSYFKAVMGYNQLNSIHQLDVPKYPAFHALNYNMTYKNNVNFMVSLQVLGLVMYIIYYIFYRRNELTCKKYGGNPQKTFNSTLWGKFLSFFNWQFFMFWNIFNMTTQILGMILHSQIEIDVILIPLQLFCMICIFFAILPLFIKRKQVPSYTQLLYYKDRGGEEQLVTLGAFAIMYMLFYFARTRSMIAYYIIMAIPVLLIVYLLYRKPFQSRWVRAAYFVNNFCIIMSLVYNRVTLEFGDQVQFLPFGNFVVICFDWIFNIVVWAREAYIICKYGGEEGLSQILQSNTKTTEEDQVDFFKPTNDYQLAKNQSVLESIMKSQNKKLDNTARRQRTNQQSNFDQPQLLKRERQKNMEDQQKNEAEALRKKRQEWSREMQETNEVRELKERTRQSIRSSRIYSPHQKRQYPSTAQRGIDQSRIESLQGSAVRYR